MCWYMTDVPPSAAIEERRVKTRSKSAMNSGRREGRRRERQPRGRHLGPDEQRHPGEVIPGARIFMIVTRKLSRSAVDDAPEQDAIVQKVVPGGPCSRDRRVLRPAGVEGAPTRNDSNRISRPANIQNAAGSARGRRCLRAPSSAGSRSCQGPATRGMTNLQTIAVACAEKSALKVPARRTGRPAGPARRVRLRPAARPRGRKEGQHQVLDADHLVIGVDPEVVLPP